MATFTLQPLGIDATLYYGSGDGNYGADVSIALISNSANKERICIKADLTGLPIYSVSSAKLSLYYYGQPFDSLTGYQVACNRATTTGWAEGTGTEAAPASSNLSWNHYTGTTHWSSAGGDYTASGQSLSYVPALNNWMEFTSMATLVGDAVANRSGILWAILVLSDEAASVVRKAQFASKDYTSDLSLRPKLYIEFTPVIEPTTEEAEGKTFNGSLVINSGSVSEVGFVWDTSSKSIAATAADGGGFPAPASSGYANHAAASGTSSPFSYEADLDAGETYYFRAYVKDNSGKYMYGDEESLVAPHTHRISNASTSGVKIGGVAVQGAKVFIIDLLNETLAGVEETDEDGYYSFDDFDPGDAIPKLLAVCVHDVKASLTTSQGLNKDLKFTAKATDADHWYPGEAGNAITIAYVHTGGLAVSVDGAAITINIDAGATTAAQIKTAIEGNSDASKMVSVAYASGQNGSGSPAAMTATNLAGGQYYTSQAHAFVTPAEID